MSIKVFYLYTIILDGIIIWILLYQKNHGRYNNRKLCLKRIKNMGTNGLILLINLKEGNKIK